MVLYYILLPLAWIVFHVGFRVRAEGRDNLKKIRTRGYILAPNHISAIDPVFVIITRFWGRRMIVFAKKELFEINAFLSWFFRCAGAMCVRGTKEEAAVIDETVARCQNGESLLIFPEGTREKDGTFLQPKSGLFVIAAAAAVEAALLRHPGIRLQLLKDRYPQGAEKQLIQALTGCQVPPGGLPASVGCAVFNAATCAAVGDAVWDGMPLVKRVVTVSGDIVMEPRNLLVPIGTPFSDMVEAAGFRQNPYKVLSGGPMMGVAQFDLAVPVTKGTNAVTVLGEENRYMAAQPHCIRCGKCEKVCPQHLHIRDLLADVAAEFEKKG